MTAIQIISATCNILAGATFVAIAIPMVKRKIKPNPWYGFRIHKAFQSEELWYDINAYGARQLMIWSIPIIMVGIACLFIPMDEHSSPTVLLTFLCGPLVVFTTIPIIMTLVYAGKK